MIEFNKEYGAGQITISDAEGICHTHSIVFKGCGEDEGDTYYLDVSFNKVEYEKITEPVENGKGDEISRRTRIRRFVSFNVYANDYYLDKLNLAVAASDTADLTPLEDDATALEIFDISLIEQQPEDFNDLHLVKVRFRIVEADDDLGKDACCGSVLAEEPYEDDCPPGGDPPDGPNCEELAIEVNRIGNDLHATVTGNEGAFVINWRYRANQNSAWTVLINGASSVGLGGFGEYEAIVNAGTCQRRDKYLYVDPCAGFRVTAEQVGIAIIAELEGECDDGFFDLAFWDTEEEDWVPQDHDNSNIFMPEETGLYLIGYTCESTQCTAETIVQFNAENTCPAITLEITRTEDELNVTVTGDHEGTLTYEWTLDDGDSVNVVSTADSAAIIGNGNYELTITVDGCQYKANKVINDPCEDDDCDLTISIDSTGIVNGVGTLEAIITTPMDTDGITVNWDRMTSFGFVPYEHGSMSTAISEQGAYRLTVMIGNCKRVKYYFNSECLDCEEFSVTITEEGGVFTADVGCEDATFNWIRMDADGDHETGVTTASITPTEPGLYIVHVDCGGCPGQGRFIAYECEECLEVFIPGEPLAIAVCPG